MTSGPASAQLPIRPLLPSDITNAADAANCRVPPKPDDPRVGMGDLLSTPPQGPTKDPFASPPQGGIWDRYGYGGLYFPLYDLGCPDTVTKSPMNTAANLGMRAMIYITAFSTFLRHYVQTADWWDVFDPVIQAAQNMAQQLLWAQGGLVTLAVLLFVVSMAWLAMHRQLSVLLKLAGVALFVLVVGHLLAFDGVRSTHTIRELVTGVTSAFESDQGSSGSGDDIAHRQVLYRTRQTGMFGDAESPVAQEYGPRLFECMTYRWDDAQTSDTIGDKQDCYRKTMSDLADHHPVEAEYARGSNATAQAFDVWVEGVPAVIAVMFWQIAAGLAGLMVQLIIIAVVVAGMFLAPVALFKGGSRVFLRPLLDMVMGSALKYIALNLAASLVTVATGILLGATRIVWPLRIIILVLLLVVVWRVTKRHRRITDGRATGAYRYVKDSLADRKRDTQKATLMAATGGAAFDWGDRHRVTSQKGDWGYERSSIGGYSKTMKASDIPKDREHKARIAAKEAAQTAPVDSWVAPAVNMDAVREERDRPVDGRVVTVDLRKPETGWDGQQSLDEFLTQNASGHKFKAMPSEAWGWMPSENGKGPR